MPGSFLKTPSSARKQVENLTNQQHKAVLASDRVIGPEGLVSFLMTCLAS
jgi:hypothetical protein